MEASVYRDSGYRLSLQVSQGEINRAEADVKAAYLDRIYADYVTPPDIIKSAMMQLAFILLLKRSAVATRSGGKVKTSPDSVTGYPTQEDFDNADRLLRLMQETYRNNGAVQGHPSKIVEDICGIYYRNQFVGL